MSAIESMTTTEPGGPSVRDVVDLMRELREVRHLPDDNPRRQAWLARKVDMLDRITGAQQ